MAKIGECTVNLQGPVLEFLENKSTGAPETIQAPPEKSPEKWTYLSLVFYNAPSLHTVEPMQLDDQGPVFAFPVLPFLGLDSPLDKSHMAARLNWWVQFRL